MATSPGPARPTRRLWPAPSARAPREHAGAVSVDLGVTAFRSGDVESVRSLAPEAQAAAVAARQPYLVAAAMALQAWVAWRDQRAEQALTLGIQALELWDAQPESYSFHCLALWPVVGSHLDTGQTAQAVGAASQLLVPPQVRMPDELEQAVAAACEAWDRERPELSGRLLAGAVQLARRLGYA